MASQLEQLIAYLDRPGVTEVALSPGKPITMTTPKGVMNVTGRPLSDDQLASLVRLTPLEELVDAATPITKAVTVAKRDVEVTIDRDGSALTIRLRRVIPTMPAPARPRTRTRTTPPAGSRTVDSGSGARPKSTTSPPSDGVPRPRAATSPPSDKLKVPARPAPRISDADIPIDLALDELSGSTPAETTTIRASSSPPIESPRAHSSTAAPPPGGASARPRTPSYGDHPNDMRPRSPSMSPFAGVTVPSAPATSTSALAGLPPSTSQPTSTSALAGLPPSTSQPTSTSALAGLPPSSAGSAAPARSAAPNATLMLAGLPLPARPSAPVAPPTDPHASSASSIDAAANMGRAPTLAVHADAPGGAPNMHDASAASAAIATETSAPVAVPVFGRTNTPAGPPGLALDLELDADSTAAGQRGEVRLPPLPAAGSDIPLPPPRTMPKLKIDVSSGSAAPREAMAATGTGSERSKTTPPARAAYGSVSLDRDTVAARGARTLQALGLPTELVPLLRRERALVLVVGARGHGKTTTLAALGDVLDRSGGLQVVAIDELRDAASIDMAVSAAESGYLVLATVTAESVAAGLEHIVRRYAEGGLGPVRNRLLDVLCVAIGKQLPPAASEIIVGDALRRLLGA